VAKDNSSVTRSHVLNTLAEQSGSTGDKWKTGGIPMWGYCNGFEVDEAPVTPTVQLTRAIARVNISIPDEAVQDVFEMDSAFLYNYSRAGSVAPVAVPGGYDAGQWKAADLVALAPNLPGLSLLVDQITPLKVKGPLAYDIDELEKHEFSQGIYTFEAGAGSAADAALPENTCLVIGGFYNGSAAPTYYRVDFIKKEQDKADEYLALLRNHSYNVVIQSVSGEGYPTKEGAFNNKPANINAEVIKWNESTIGDVVFDGKNYIGVGPTEFTLSGSARAGNRITVKSSIAWTVTVTDAEEGGDPVDWITPPSGAFSGAGNVDAILFNTLENSTLAERVAYIHVNAGGMLDFVVKVTQRHVADAAVWVTGASGLSFSGVDGVQPADAGYFRLHWLPTSKTVTASIEIGGTFKYDEGSDKPGTVLTEITDDSWNGEKMFTVRPAALAPEDDPLVEKVSTVVFTIENNSVTDEARVELRYINYQIIPTANAVYMLDGGEHSFRVRSSTEWYISNVTGDAIFAESLLGREGGPNITTLGEEVKFQLLTGHSEFLEGTATLTLSDKLSLASDQIVVIHGATCGTDGNAIALPVGQNLYLTHMYYGKCWMVENSREGNYSSVGFGLDASGNPLNQNYFNTTGTSITTGHGVTNGYYYAPDQAASACPSGWRLPTLAEATELVGLYNQANINKWWLDVDYGAFAGNYDVVSYDGSWWAGNQRGYWWYDTYKAFSAGSGSVIIQNETYTAHWMSVRCVME
jgi:hypothetical protein